MKEKTKNAILLAVVIPAIIANTAWLIHLFVNYSQYLCLREVFIFVFPLVPFVFGIATRKAPASVLVGVLVFAGFWLGREQIFGVVFDFGGTMGFLFPSFLAVIMGIEGFFASRRKGLSLLFAICFYLLFVAIFSSVSIGMVYSSFPQGEPGTKVIYPGSTINITLPSTPSDQQLLLYYVGDRFPKPESKGVPRNTYISVGISRPPPILKLETEPEIEIGRVEKKYFCYGGKYTFYPAKPLQPDTNYTIKVTFGSESAAKTTSWQFTTTTRTWVFWRTFPNS